MDHHGGVVFVTDRRIQVPDELMGPLSIRHHSRVYALFYPCPKSYAGVPRRWDLVITPHAPRLWPFLARFSIRLAHRAGTLARVAEVLKKEKASILTAQCTRAGHRFGTWTFVCTLGSVYELTSEAVLSAARENLSSDFQEIAKLPVGVSLNLENPPRVIGSAEYWNSICHLGQITRNRTCREIERLVHIISDKCHEDLYIDEDLTQESIRAKEIECLQYFHQVALRRYWQHAKAQKSSPSRPTGAGWTEPLRGTRYGEWLDFSRKQPSGRLRQESDIKLETPTRGFAAADLEEQTIRVALIDPAELPKFAHIDLEYELKGSTSLGLIAKLAELLHERWNIWRLEHRTIEHSERYEKGAIELFLEETPSEKFGAAPDLSKIEEQLGVWLNDRGSISRSTYGSLAPYTLFLSLSYGEPHTELCVQLCHLVGIELGVLRNDWRLARDAPQASVTEGVIAELRRCNGVVQVFASRGDGRTTDSLTWLNAETLAAGITGKPFARVVDVRLADEVMKVRKDDVVFRTHLGSPPGGLKAELLRVAGEVIDARAASRSIAKSHAVDTEQQDLETTLFEIAQRICDEGPQAVAFASMQDVAMPITKDVASQITKEELADKTGERLLEDAARRAKLKEPTRNWVDRLAAALRSATASVVQQIRTGGAR